MAVDRSRKARSARKRKRRMASVEHGQRRTVDRADGGVRWLRVLRRKRLDERAFLLRHLEITAALAVRFPAVPVAGSGGDGRLLSVRVTGRSGTPTARLEGTLERTAATARRPQSRIRRDATPALTEIVEVLRANSGGQPPSDV